MNNINLNTSNINNPELPVKPVESHTARKVVLVALAILSAAVVAAGVLVCVGTLPFSLPVWVGIAAACTGGVALATIAGIAIALSRREKQRPPQPTTPPVLQPDPAEKLVAEAKAKEESYKKSCTSQHAVLGTAMKSAEIVKIQETISSTKLFITQNPHGKSLKITTDLEKTLKDAQTLLDNLITAKEAYEKLEGFSTHDIDQAESLSKTLKDALNELPLQSFEVKMRDSFQALVDLCKGLEGQFEIYHAIQVAYQKVMQLVSVLGNSKTEKELEDNKKDLIAGIQKVDKLKKNLDPEFRPLTELSLKEFESKFDEALKQASEAALKQIGNTQEEESNSDGEVVSEPDDCAYETPPTTPKNAAAQTTAAAASKPSATQTTASAASTLSVPEAPAAPSINSIPGGLPIPTSPTLTQSPVAQGKLKEMRSKSNSDSEFEVMSLDSIKSQKSKLKPAKEKMNAHKKERPNPRTLSGLFMGKAANLRTAIVGRVESDDESDDDSNDSDLTISSSSTTQSDSIKIKPKTLGLNALMQKLGGIATKEKKGIDCPDIDPTKARKVLSEMLKNRTAAAK